MEALEATEIVSGNDITSDAHGTTFFPRESGHDSTSGTYRDPATLMTSYPHESGHDITRGLDTTALFARGDTDGQNEAESASYTHDISPLEDRLSGSG